MRKLIVLVIILLIILGAWSGISNYARNFALDFRLPDSTTNNSQEKVRIIDEESVVVDIVEKVTSSVVTVGIEQRVIVSPFDFFGPPQTTKQEQDIGSGFIVSSDGLIVTNKHVVDSSGKYKVITHDGKKYDVQRIYRDPSNDLAIVKINATGLKPVEMGDSSKVKVGQLVVAVGTPLGEFRGSVTKGIVSGIGRGITAGSPFEGYVERLDDVIQTDAAINPGNSGGPLVNSSGQVIGINTAVASGAENIGFAIPINVLKDALDDFNRTGGFIRPYLGVAYRMISRDLAILHELPEGAYIQEVVEGSAADKADIIAGDIITKFDGKKITPQNGGLAEAISKKKAGDTVILTVWRAGDSEGKDSKMIEIRAILESTPNQ